MSLEKGPKERQINRFKLLKTRYRKALEAYKTLKPQVEYQTNLALNIVGEVMDELWRRALANPGEDIEAQLNVPGGKLLKIRNIKASELQDFKPETYSADSVVHHTPRSLFKADELLEITIVPSSSISISSEDSVFTVFLHPDIQFATHPTFSLEESTEEETANIKILTAAYAAALDQFSRRTDSLGKALIVNELVQVIYQIADNKLKAPANP